LSVKQYHPGNALLLLPLSKRELSTSGHCMMTNKRSVRVSSGDEKPLRAACKPPAQQNAVVKTKSGLVYLAFTTSG
jgi:hypothetical protein